MLKQIAIVLTISLLFSMGFAWIGYPHLLGYIATGVFLGPFTRFTENPFVIDLLGHLGMLMMLFIIGLEFDLVKFRKIWKKALIIVLLQLVFGLVVGFSLFYALNLSFECAVLISFLLTLSSTAVVVKLLEEMNEINTKSGDLIISILIVQDLVIVPMMLILKGFNTHSSIDSVFSSLLISVGFLVALISYLGKKSNKLLNPLKSIFQGNHETMTLANVVVCFGCSTIASAAGLSSAYGAFIGGLVVGSFGNKKQILQIVTPISSLLIMMFFISVGSNIDLKYIITNWAALTMVSSALLIAKILMNYIILRFVKYTRRKSLFVATMLSQASEFSFTFIAILANGNFLGQQQQAMLNSLVVISLTIGSVFPVIAESWYRKIYNEEN